MRKEEAKTKSSLEVVQEVVITSIYVRTKPICGRGVERNVDPDEECMLHLMRALCVKVAIPVFKGDKNDDPIEFKTKALDYMEATDIPVREHV